MLFSGNLLALGWQHSHFQIRFWHLPISGITITDTRLALICFTGFTTLNIGIDIMDH